MIHQDTHSLEVTLRQNREDKKGSKRQHKKSAQRNGVIQMKMKTILLPVDGRVMYLIEERKT
jgi:hypothetical protein